MGLETLTSLIGTLGFPIATSIALFWFIIQTNDKYTETLEKLRGTIEENTRLIHNILVLIKKDEEEE